MEKEKLIQDLKKMLKEVPDEIANEGTNFYLLSENEIEGIIQVLERIN